MSSHAVPRRSSLPRREAAPSHALDPDTATPIGRAIARRAGDAGGRSMVVLIPGGVSAFATRSLLARAATRTLDVQYYIWSADLTGVLLLKELLAAADRGVRVRCLLDDNRTQGLDPILTWLDGHPNIEVRVFNPNTHRRVRALGFMTGFTRLNRRMHNKSWTADNQATIIGGRNVADEYFAAGEGIWFADLDALGAGPVAQEVSRSFDGYWNDAAAFPIGNVARVDSVKARRAWERVVARFEGSAAVQAYAAAVAQDQTVDRLVDGTLEVEWAEVRLVADEPRKIFESPDDASVRLGPRLAAALGAPARALDIVSPYFVPRDDGARALGAYARRGVAVRVLTNSQASTDAIAVHAGYLKSRSRLLTDGVELWELRPRGETMDRRAFSGSSGASLHAKTLVVDRERLFVGSFNMDPRSVRLNTELGFVIHSPKLASAVADAFTASVPTSSFAVSTRPTGGLQWTARSDTGVSTFTKEPRTSLFGRLLVRMLSHLPIDWLL